MIRVVIPSNLRVLAKTQRENEIQVDGVPTIDAVLDALESEFPALRGTIRDHVTKKRRPFIRFFVSGEDWSHEPTDTPLPASIARGEEPLYIIGAIAGG
jgi:molybdopterin synthase sulfur carrier subunit